MWNNIECMIWRYGMRDVLDTSYEDLACIAAMGAGKPQVIREIISLCECFYLSDLERRFMVYVLLTYDGDLIGTFNRAKIWLKGLGL